MAYKFQLGAFTASGSITVEDALNADGIISGSAALSASAIKLDDATSIAGDGLENSSGKARVKLNTNSGLNRAAAGLSLNLNGNSLQLGASGLSVNATQLVDEGIQENSGKFKLKLSGSQSGLGLDAGGVFVSASQGGGIEVGSDGLEITIVNDGATVNVADDVFNFGDANNGGNVRSGSFVDLASGFAGNGIGASAGVLSVAGGDGITQESSGVKVTPAQTTITSVKNDALVVGRSTGNDHIDFSAAGTVAIETDNVARVTVIDASTTVSNNLIVAGNLTVNGTTTTVNSATVVVTQSIAFEGVDDGNETTLTATNPTSDHTITLPDMSGHVPLLAGAVGNANVTSAEFLLLDGGSTVDTATVADGDAVLFNDAGTMKQLNVTSLKTYFQSGVTADSATKLKRTVNTNGPTLNTGKKTISDDSQVDYFPITASATAEISGSWTAGDLVTIKAGSGVSTSVVLTVSSAAGYNYTYDGSATLSLESPYAAVDLVYVSGASGNDWIVL